MYSASGETLSTVPWEIYPRPQMMRNDWLCLNGKWKFLCGKTESSIVVPFCPESILSGISFKTDPGLELIYSRSFSIPESWYGKRILIHFGAVSRTAVVRINGKEAVSHEENYLPFSADITELLRNGDNEITVTVVNDLSRQHPWGKQRNNAAECGTRRSPVSGRPYGWSRSRSIISVLLSSGQAQITRKSPRKESAPGLWNWMVSVIR